MKLSNVNLKVALLDSDYYAREAINGYLAWDRRTRVTFLASTLDELWDYVQHTPRPELPDVIILDADHMGGAPALAMQVSRLREQISNLSVICLTQMADRDLIEAAVEAGVRAYWLKADVRLHIAYAVVFASQHDLTISPGIAKAAETILHPRLKKATMLPSRRNYPELTQRIRQAIELCVVKGMPAQVAADEMGISLHTVRSYIKEGYRILEAYDETEYPTDMSPQERAFMRLTGLEDDST
jgi:DNA-binding NarL/FixJ family response regulator